MKMLYVVLIMLVLGLVGCDKKVKHAADAYICGEPPDEVTFYCKVGTGPPRTDCSAAQTGEFDVDPITC